MESKDWVADILCNNLYLQPDGETTDPVSIKKATLAIRNKIIARFPNKDTSDMRTRDQYSIGWNAAIDHMRMELLDE